MIYTHHILSYSVYPFVEKSSKTDRKDLLSELEMLKKLSDHPNVIKFKGCVTMSGITCGDRLFGRSLYETCFYSSRTTVKVHEMKNR